MARVGIEPTTPRFSARSKEATQIPAICRQATERYKRWRYQSFPGVSGAFGSRDRLVTGREVAARGRKVGLCGERANDRLRRRLAHPSARTPRPESPGPQDGEDDRQDERLPGATTAVHGRQQALASAAPSELATANDGVAPRRPPRDGADRLGMLSVILDSEKLSTRSVQLVS